MPFAALLAPAPAPPPAAGRPEEPAAGADPAEREVPFFAELALARLAALEAFERASRRFLERFGEEVLGRELALAPCDLERLLGRALERFAAHAPVTVVLSPGDAERVTVALPVRVDPQLRPGDAIVEVRDGAFESSAAFRLEALLTQARSDPA